MNHADRMNRLRTILADRGLDAAVISHPSNRFYLSGYSGEDVPPDESAGFLLIDPGTAALLTSATNLGWAQAEANGLEVVAWTRPWARSVAERIRGCSWRRVGFEDTAMTVAMHRGIIDELGDAVALVPLGGLVDDLRLVKDAGEIETLAAAIRLGDLVFGAATADLDPGMTERGVAWRIERLMREHGADGPAFPTIVAAGPHGARPHHDPTDRPIGSGEPVVIDMGARLNGYHGDLTRTIWLGQPSPRLREVYNVVERAQAAALKEIRAGVRAKDIDAFARVVVEAAGYGDAFTHGLGHGLGVRVHEGPSLSKTSDDVLEAGQVVTVEPGVYLPDWGGVRIEDVGVVEQDGFRVLTTAPKPTFAD